MAGGEATWYERICTTVPPDRLIVLAPHVPGDHAFDVRQPYRVVRKRVPVTPHPFGRMVQIVLLIAHAVGIVRRERIDAVHIGHLYLGPVGVALKRVFGTPYVLYLHGGEMADYMRGRAVRSVVRGIVRGARLIVVNSTYTRRWYEASGARHPHTETLTIGVDLDRFRPDLDARQLRAKYGLDGAKVILTVGRLVERKGHDVVIRALRHVRERVGSVRYLIVGDGPEENRLRMLAGDVGCAEDVIFAGHVSGAELPLLYAASDVFVMPSRALARRDGVEGFGIAFLEAAACGKPVIGGRSGGIADAVVDGVTGILVDPSSVEEISNVLTRLLLDREEAARLGQQARARTERLQDAWRTRLTGIWEQTTAESQSGSHGG
jgi:phosphatidylinositol alpha-1,6-mannosyltransferase